MYLSKLEFVLGAPYKKTYPASCIAALCQIDVKIAKNLGVNTQPVMMLKHTRKQKYVKSNDQTRNAILLLGLIRITSETFSAYSRLYAQVLGSATHFNTNSTFFFN